MNSHSNLDSTTRESGSLADICSLSPEHQNERLEMIKREILPKVRSQELLENGLAWNFDATPGLREELEEFARFERQCCTSLEFEIEVAADATGIRLTMLGADPHSGLFDPLRLDLQPVEAGVGEKLKRFFKTGGIAAAASFFLFCVVPIGLVSLLGSSIAAPLLKLDNPFVMAAGTVALGLGLWRFEKRRATRKQLAAGGNGTSDCGC